MLRSMYSGISGMKANQTKLDVIGNNIANVGTTGYKASRARFQDTLYQNINDAMAPTTNQGGVNAKQVGLGVQLAGIDAVMSQGMMQTTGRALDVAVDGDGFFMVSKGPAVFGDNTLQISNKAGAHNITAQSLSNSGSQIMYSRDGAFALDESGNLITSDGYRVMGYALTNDDNAQAPTAIAPNAVKITDTIATPNTSLNFSFGAGTQLNGYHIVLGNVGPGTVPGSTVDKTTSTITVNGDFSTGTNLTTDQIQAAINKSLSAAGISQSVSVSGTVPAYANLSTTVFGAGDATTAPTATSNVVGGYTVGFNNGAELNGYKVKIGNMAPGTPTTAEVDKDSKTITIDGDFAAGGVTAAAIQTEVNNALAGKGFTETATVGGAFNAIAGTDVASAVTNGGTSVESIAEDGTINFVDGAKTVKAYDGTLKSLRIPESVKIPGTSKELKVTSYTIDKTGIINAVLENGSVAAVGQIAISSFNNPEGLTKLGKDLYSDSANSGTATIRTGVGTTGDDNSQGYGDLAQGMLEMSNVDLAEQFTDMIVANRAFQASSKMITTGDDILQDIINLKR